MREELRKLWGGYVDWYAYMKNYKHNKDYDALKEQECVAKDNEIERLKKVIDERSAIAKEKDSLIQILLDRVELKNQQLTDAKKELKELKSQQVKPKRRKKKND